MLGAGGVGKSGKFEQQHFWGERVNLVCEVYRKTVLFNEELHCSFSCTWLGLNTIICGWGNESA